MCQKCKLMLCQQLKIKLGSGLPGSQGEQRGGGHRTRSNKVITLKL